MLRSRLILFFTYMITDQIGFHLVVLPLLIKEAITVCLLKL